MNRQDAMGQINEQAPAKLNLGLRILGRRSDGYHDILSVFQTVTLCDRLVFEPGDSMETALACSDPGLSSGPDNLVCRAVEALRAATGETRGVRIFLEKHIPMGAGLGGGSSDAAATLRALNRIWDAGLSDAQLCALGEKLGSDVPFLVRPGTAVATGRGERLRYFTWRKETAYVLIYPGFQVATAWAYGNFKKALTGTGHYDKFLNSVDLEEISACDLLRCLENDFLPLVAQTHPNVPALLERLRASGAMAASMSGSGSTLYGVFETRAAARIAFESFKADGYRAFLCCPTQSP